MNQVILRAFKSNEHTDNLSVIKQLKSLLTVQSNLIQICLDSQGEKTSPLEEKLKAIQSLSQSQSILIQNYLLQINSIVSDEEGLPF